MNRVLTFLVCVCLGVAAGNVRGNDQIDKALEQALSSGLLKDRREALSMLEYGPSRRLLEDKTFTNLVSVVSGHIDECSTAYVISLREALKRKVFIVALTKCGEDVYRKALVRWFGDGDLSFGGFADVVDSFITPTRTDLEDWVSMNYAEQDVRKMLCNVRAGCLAISNEVMLAKIDSLLSGAVKAKNELYAGMGVCPVLDGLKQDRESSVPVVAVLSSGVVIVFLMIAVIVISRRKIF